MRSYVYASLAVHLTATLLWGAVTVLLREPLEPLQVIQVDLATLPVVQPPEEEPAPQVRPEPVQIPPEPETVEDRRPDPEEAAIEEPEPTPVEEIVPPDPDLPPAPEPEPEPEPQQPDEDVDFLEPDEVSAQAQESPPAEAEPQPESSAPVPTAGVQIERQEGMPDYYLALMQNKINRRWDPSAARTRGGAQALCLIRFRVTRAGEILEPRVLESSGFSVFDREALSAVIAASPLPPPPPESRVPDLPITVRFHLDR